MDPLATVEQVADWLPFDMDEGEQRECQGAIAYLSDDARDFGSDSWVDEASSPRQVINLVIKAAVRHMKNYEGYTNSRAGDESVSWGDHKGEDAGSATFSASEKKRLGEMAGRFHSGLHTAGVYAWESKPRRQVVGRVPTSTGGTFPFFASDTEPW
ncbi:hypothetical protein [Nocardioides alkalitolerans]|uniref:hypothetical protein n=1 Tax=Nocardioides alkalitolerans TaxID=281714 RepID=UPI00048DE439|nr:hypothetical protein [Nocardioides alkalitolerans]